MATPTPGVWGIDLGQCGLKAIRLELTDGNVIATAFDYVEHPKILSQPDADPDQLIREALEKFLSRNTLRGDTVVISVPGQSGLARFVKLPPVEEKKITDIVKFEAKQQIPFPLEEVVWDFQKIGAGTVTDGFAMETEIGLFAMKRDMVNRYLQHFTDVNVEVHVVQMAPLALCNFVSYDLLGKSAGDAPPAEDEEQPAEEDEDEESAGKKKCIVALDIGADSSNLVITDGEKIIWQRPIPLGGNHFTRALTKDLKLTFAKAEHIKRNAIKSPDLRKILAALKPVLNDFVQEVQRSLGYFANTHRDAHVKYMIGLGNAFRLPGLQKFLQEKLALEVRKLQSLERLGGEEVTTAPQFSENVLSFAVAYGLALQGLKLPRLQTNLLPHEIRIERLVRAKKPWAVTAAAALLLGIAGLAFGYSVPYKVLTDPGIDKADKAAKEVVKRRDTSNATYTKLESDAAEAKRVVTRIAAGVDERFNWNLLYKYINDSLPQPNGKKLALQTRQGFRAFFEYFDKNKDAQWAYQELLKKQVPSPTAAPLKVSDEMKLDNDIKRNLVQINIEGITSLYSDDLSGFFKNLVDEKNGLRGMDEKEQALVRAQDKEKLPKSGWVFEIRGYTYHEGSVQFVENTFLENLANPEAAGVVNKLSEDMKKRVKDNISYLFVYQIAKVDNPDPGSLKYLGTSSLRKLVATAAAPAAGPGAEGRAPATPGATPDASQISRDAWIPLGEIAPTSLGAASAGGGGFRNAPGPQPVQPAPVGTGTAPAQRRQARIEFAIMFIWQEPQPQDRPPDQQQTR